MCARKFLTACLMFGFSLILNGVTTAQSNHDLDPPMQSDTETSEIQMSAAPNEIPTYRFVVLTLDGNKLEISQTLAEQEKLSVAGTGDMEMFTEMVTQTYQVQVPYTEKVDGKNVTKVRTETRTRQVPVTRNRRRAVVEGKKKKAKKGDDSGPVMETIEMPYTVNVPYQEMVDGKPVTKIRQEKRIRTMQVARGKVATKPASVKKSYTVADVKCFGVGGNLLSVDEIRKRLEEKAPAILIKDSKAITAYFESLLNPNAIFVIQP